MRLFLALLTTLALAGCLRPIQANLPRDPGPAKGPEIVVLVSKTGQAARTLMHDVAVHCWLDGIVVGAQMIVKPGGNIIIVGDRDNLIAADYLGLKGSTQPLAPVWHGHRRSGQNPEDRPLHRHRGEDRRDLLPQHRRIRS